jgi:predicted lipoprotein with Yx(FWY)xxD motif
MKRQLVVGVALGLASCQGDSSVVDTGGRSLQVPVPSRGTAATAKGPEKDILEFPRRAKQDLTRLGVANGRFGPYLTDAGGRALYVFSEDAKGQPACQTNCATVWPPAIVDKLPAIAEPAIERARVALITRADGSRQLSYFDLPLYYSESDRKSGDTWGHFAMSFGGHFALISPAGKPLPPPR